LKQLLEPKRPDIKLRDDEAMTALAWQRRDGPEAKRVLRCARGGTGTVCTWELVRAENRPQHRPIDSGLRDPGP
jgi:hypothetical protein